MPFSKETGTLTRRGRKHYRTFLLLHHTCHAGTPYEHIRLQARKRGFAVWDHAGLLISVLYFQGCRKSEVLLFKSLSPSPQLKLDSRLDGFGRKDTGIILSSDGFFCKCRLEGSRGRCQILLWSSRISKFDLNFSFFLFSQLVGYSYKIQGRGLKTRLSSFPSQTHGVLCKANIAWVLALIKLKVKVYF